MSVRVDVTYQGDLHCRAVHGPSSAALVTDAPTDNGGKGEVFSPTDLVATALGSCLLTVMGLLARREGLDLEGACVTVVKDMAVGPPRRIGALTATVTLPASLHLTAAQRAKLEAVARVCPVRASLHPDVALDLRFAWPD